MSWYLTKTDESVIKQSML